jgi:anti-sigma regulatory factor (Ser/Thr protein kinase)/biotin operon repressor
MGTARDRILRFLTAHRSATGRELREHLGISRQALSAQLRPLIQAGEVLKSGATRGASYRLPGGGVPARLVRSLEIEGLDETAAYEVMAARLNLGSELTEPIEAIVRYAFTEMLNNAVDHSGAESCRVELALDERAASFAIRDRGIGVFATIASKLRLKDEYEAMVELVKGRTTTMPEAHSGEGLFFTARVASTFVLRSHRIELEWDRARDDVFVRNRRHLEGTDVRFSVRRSARQRLEAVFAEFAPAEFDYEFLRTQVHVKLLQRRYVSRSEAKRLLANLDRFRRIELDFRDVETVGQGFADEVFRVFASRHPQIEFEVRHASPAVAAMLRHGGWKGGPGPR